MFGVSTKFRKYLFLENFLFSVILTPFAMALTNFQQQIVLFLFVCVLEIHWKFHFKIHQFISQTFVRENTQNLIIKSLINSIQKIPGFERQNVESK
jgi:hypothetical protein